MDDDVEFILEVALEHSEDEEVNYHIRTALQKIQIERDMKELDIQ